MAKKSKDGAKIMRKAIELVRSGDSLRAIEFLLKHASAACPDQSTAQKTVFAMQRG